MTRLPRWAVIAIIVLAIIAAIALARCSAPSPKTAVALDRADAAAEGYRIGIEAERAATSNQAQRDDAFANDHRN